MVQYLKLLPHKALKEESFRALGKINVICGQNSSGKSTLMEAIDSEKKRFVGKKLTPNDIEEIYAHSSRNMAWRDGNEVANPLQRAQLNSLAVQYRTIVEQIAETKEVWFADDAPFFLQQFRLQWETDQHIFGRFSTPEAEVVDVYKKIFQDETATILIPPKRRLELSCKLALNELIHNDGHGLLARLFFAKNQADGTEEHQTYNRIAIAFANISGGHEFDIVPTLDNTLNLSFALLHDPWRPAQDCGLGLQDLLVLLYFASAAKYSTVLIEEPESHLHPTWQRKLLAFFHEAPDKQFFLTTHSNIFLDAGLVDRVFFTTLEGSVRVDDATGRAAILTDLGYSVTDNLVSDLIILVEGPSDVPVIEEFLIKMGLYAEYSIKIWPLGGDIMGQTDLTVFAEKYDIVALVDNDPGSVAARNKFAHNCEALGIPVTRLSRYAIENYFTLSALQAVFGVQIPSGVRAIAEDVPLGDQIGINVKKNNRKITQVMTMTDLQGTDLGQFLAMIERRLKKTSKQAEE